MRKTLDLDESYFYDFRFQTDVQDDFQIKKYLNSFLLSLSLENTLFTFFT